MIFAANHRPHRCQQQRHHHNIVVGVLRCFQQHQRIPREGNLSPNFPVGVNDAQNIADEPDGKQVTRNGDTFQREKMPQKIAVHRIEHAQRQHLPYGSVWRRGVNPFGGKFEPRVAGGQRGGGGEQRVQVVQRPSARANGINEKVNRQRGVTEKERSGENQRNVRGSGGEFLAQQPKVNAKQYQNPQNKSENPRSGITGEFRVINRRDNPIQIFQQKKTGENAPVNQF